VDEETLIDKAIIEATTYVDWLGANRKLRIAASEAGLNYDWLCMFKQRRIPNPTIEKLNKVLKYKQQQQAKEAHEQHTTH
jgi:hypothetical protein